MSCEPRKLYFPGPNFSKLPKKTLEVQKQVLTCTFESIVCRKRTQVEETTTSKSHTPEKTASKYL